MFDDKSGGEHFGCMCFSRDFFDQPMFARLNEFAPSSHVEIKMSKHEFAFVAN